MATTVRVAVRARPLSAKERLANTRDVLRFEPDGQTVVLNAGATSMTSQNSDALRTFNYDHSFSPATPQSVLYDVCARPLLDKFLDGFNATILAYGQTGSGKTFSMGTGLDGNVNTEHQGIVPRAIASLFQHLDQIDPARFRYRVMVSFLELYNEELIDLLNPRMASKLQIREDGQGGVTWTGVREEECKRVDEVMAVLQRGSLCRTTGATEMNVQSSRSHAIFTVTLRQQKWEPRKVLPDVTAQNADASAAEGSETDNQDSVMPVPVGSSDQPNLEVEGEWHHISSKFHFVDLAGSERLKRTRAEGDRAKEGISINQGLLALGNVISALTEESVAGGGRPGSARHVPYRDSKLTRLLQDSLGGNSQTLMLACVAAGDADIAETLGTLRYAERARRIKNRAVVNRDYSGGAAPEEMIKLRRELENLRRELDIVRGVSPNIDVTRAVAGALCVRCGAGLGPAQAPVSTSNLTQSCPVTSVLPLSISAPAASNAHLALLEKELHLVRAARDKALQEAQMLQFSVSRMKERREEQDKMVAEWRAEYEAWVVEKGIKRKVETGMKCVKETESSKLEVGQTVHDSDQFESPAQFVERQPDITQSVFSSSSVEPVVELAAHPFILRHLEEIRYARTRAQDAEDRAEYFEKQLATFQASANTPLGVGISLTRKPSFVGGFDTRPSDVEVKALEEIKQKRQALDVVAKATKGVAQDFEHGVFRPRQSRMRDLEVRDVPLRGG
ncbi:Kinesin-like protein kif21b [Gonapodya sp. JEL0774]|nr:Kinesin-like protein kif21b [Gonapodya sp. JEL0774]